MYKFKAEEGVMTPRPACHLEMGMRTLDVYQQVGSQIWSLPICTLMTISILCTLPDSCGQSSTDGPDVVDYTLQKSHSPTKASYIQLGDVDRRRLDCFVRLYEDDSKMTIVAVTAA
jgi:hypothetical protein